MKKAIIATTAVLVFGCTEAAEETPLTPAEGPSANKLAATQCAVIESSNWLAWVDAMPGPDTRPTLHVTGDIVLPTPGYTISWRLGALDRMQPPGQRLVLETMRPEGMVAQVITPVAVAYAGESAITDYREVIVSCGDKVLATISDVTVAQ